MKRTVFILAIGAVIAVLGLGGLAALPSGSIDAGVVSVGVEQADAKPVKSSGKRGADLIAEIVVPLLIVGVGVIAAVALAKREVGLALSAAAVGLIAGFFTITPDLAERAFEGIYKAIF